MPYTKIQIINLALQSVGKSPVNNISEGGAIAQAADAAYDLFVPLLLKSYDWRFATKFEELSKQLIEPIIDEYRHIYQLPADLLQLTRLLPTLNDYILVGNTIYTNHDQTLYAEYRYEANVGVFPDDFVYVIINAIARQLSLSSALKDEYFKIFDQRYTTSLALALSNNSKQAPNKFIKSFPLLEVRG
jgi:hypothetical protein